MSRIVCHNLERNVGFSTARLGLKPPGYPATPDESGWCDVLPEIWVCVVHETAVHPNGSLPLLARSEAERRGCMFGLGRQMYSEFIYHIQFSRDTE